MSRFAKTQPIKHVVFRIPKDLRKTCSLEIQFYLWPWPFIRQIKQVKMIAVGVGSGVDNNELKEIADGKRENVIHVDKFDELVNNENNVLFASCEPGRLETNCTTREGNYFARDLAYLRSVSMNKTLQCGLLSMWHSPHNIQYGL